MEYLSSSLPENASTLDPSVARALFRRNEYCGPTSKFCFGCDQANILILPAELADDFEEFCNKNPAPFPLLYRSKLGDSSAPPLAKDSDVKTDLPRYLIYREGKLIQDACDLCQFEQSFQGMVSFYIGCSFTFESALRARGIRMKNTDLGLVTSVYLSTIKLHQVGPITGSMVTTMRPIKKHQLSEAFLVSSQYPKSHGAPIHIGDPARIGIMDLSAPIAGDLSTFEEDEVPVFWGCGFSVTQILPSIAPPLAFTHGPASMFISDVKPEPKVIPDKVSIVELSRANQPFYASVLELKRMNVLLTLEKALLDDPMKRGVIHLHQDSDLLKAVLSLSHANRVAITTGFPMHEVNSESAGGLSGALSICQALLVLNKEVVLISDSETLKLFESCVNYMNFKSPVAVISCSKAMEMWREACLSNPPWDCLLAIKRAGGTKDGTYRTVSSNAVLVEPIDDLFTMAESNPFVSTISIGDEGNELGMGKVYEQVVKYIPNGATIACKTAADHVIVAGASVWGGYAVSLGLYLASSSPMHWRYKNYGLVDTTDYIPKFSVQDFIPNSDQVRSLLMHMNTLGISDGTTMNKLPLQIHLEKVTELASLIL